MTSTRQKTREMLSKAEKCYICFTPSIKSYKITEINSEYLKTLSLCVPEIVSRSFCYVSFLQLVSITFSRNGVERGLLARVAMRKWLVYISLERNVLLQKQ